MLEKKMLLPVVVVALWLSVPDFHFEAYGDAVGDAKSCDPPCQQLSPPVSGDPSYGALPPPQPSPPPSGYSIYGYPPPPPKHHEGGQSKCPPAPGVQCCTPPAPYTFYGPPTNPYYYGPPNPYAPPNTYTYVPYGEGHGSASLLLPSLAPLLMFFSPFILF